MKSYEELEAEFDKKVEALQNECPHETATWMEKWWAIGHSCGYSVRVCDNCRKVLEENPTSEQRKKDESKRIAQMMNRK